LARRNHVEFGLLLLQPLADRTIGAWLALRVEKQGDESKIQKE
jgi:hypothetical protein